MRDRLVHIISTTREEFSAWSIAIGLAWAALATALLAILLWLLARIRRRIQARVEGWFARLTDPESADIYSALHAQIQECFNRAGVEIMSPDYLALRDGNRATTPRQPLPSAMPSRPSEYVSG